MQDKKTHMDSTSFFRSATVGIEEFRLVRESWNEEGNVRFAKPSRLGTLI
jgi:hypothetical protein